MKKIIPLSFGFLALSVGVLAGFKHTHFEIAKAYDKASLPTTINLNAVEEADVRNYYSALNALSPDERTGNDLLKNLKPILMNGQKYYSYDVGNGKDIWKMYEITDRDWDKSPASEISGYDASTGIITGYKYGDSASNKGSNPYIHALYVNRGEGKENKVHAWATDAGKTSHGGNNEWCIDREHIWPKSQGFEDSDADPGTSGARGDPMHLWAGDSYVNSALHSNYFYGNVDKTKTYTDGKDKYTYVSGNYMGFSKTLGGSVSVFEPQDSDKGDIARAVFYMVARYNNLAGNDSTIENDNPNLELVSDLTEWKQKGYISTSTKTGKYGILSDLLEWNKLDPVDEFEIRRNDLLFRNYTNNRNPFIDFPQWADIIWGETKDIEYAQPTKDAIGDSVIVLKDFNPNITEGQEMKFSATVEGGAEITWEIEDETIATIEKYVAPVKSAYQIRVKSSVTVESGTEVVIKPVKVGQTKLTAKTIVGGDPYEKTYSIKVVSKSEQKDQGNILETILKNPLYLGIAIGVIVLVIIIVIVFIAVGTKKQKKIVKKTIKKTVKKSNSGSKGKKK